jgi:hypothetical protein
MQVREIVMSRRLLIAVGIVSVGIWSCSSYAATDSVPNWDVSTSCRGAAEAGFVQDTAANLKRCVESEQHTREVLSKDWSSFPAADRAKCVKTQTFSPTYSELATCLEMNRDLRNAAKPADPMPQRK